MKKGLLILNMMICLFANGQDKNFSSLNGGYYFYINKAELAVVDSAFNAADSLYQVAFQKANHSSGQDYFLAALNAIRINNETRLYGYLKEAIQRGVTKKQIKHNANNRPFEFNNELLSEIEYKENRQIYLNSRNRKLSKKIHRMVLWDQAVRTIPGFFELFSYNADSKHFRVIKELCYVFNGLPQYSLRSVDHKKDLEGVGLLLRHFHQYELECIAPYIMNSIDSGYFNPCFYATALEYKIMINPKIVAVSQDSVSFNYRFKYGMFSAKYLGQEFSQGDCSVVDSIRSSKGIEPITDQFKKNNKVIADYYKYPADTTVVISKNKLGKMWWKKWALN
jgi:hypothetical protein